MIPEYEVAATLAVIDESSATMERILGLSERLVTSWATLEKSGKGLFSGTGATPFAAALERINTAAPITVDWLGKLGPAAETAFGQFGGAATTSLGTLRGINAELRESVALTNAVGATAPRARARAASAAAANLPLAMPGVAAAAAAPVARATEEAEELAAAHARAMAAATVVGTAGLTDLDAAWSRYGNIQKDVVSAAVASQQAFGLGSAAQAEARRATARYTEEAALLASSLVPYVPSVTPGLAGAAEEEAVATSAAARVAGEAGRGAERAATGGMFDRMHGSMSIPMPPVGHVRMPFGVTPALAGAGMMGYGLYEGMLIRDAVTRAILTAGEKLSDAGFEATEAELELIIKDAAHGTGLQPSEVAGAIPAIVRQMSGFPMAERMAVMPKVLRFAALEERFKGVPLSEGAESIIGLIHMQQQYGAKEINELTKTVFAASLVTPLTLQQLTRASGYALPITQQLEGVDPHDLVLSLAFMERAGISNTKSGTWMLAFYQHLIEGTRGGNLLKDDSHGAALRALGLADSSGHLTFLDPAGKVDTEVALGHIHELLAHAKDTMTPEQFTGFENQALYKAFGTQGERAAAMLLSPAYGEQMPELRKWRDRLPDDIALFEQFERESPLQDTRVALSDLTTSLVDAAHVALPGFVDAINLAVAPFRGLSWILEHLGLAPGTQAPGAGGGGSSWLSSLLPDAGHVASDALWAGGLGYLFRRPLGRMLGSAWRMVRGFVAGEGASEGPWKSSAGELSGAVIAGSSAPAAIAAGLAVSAVPATLAYASKWSYEHRHDTPEEIARRSAGNLAEMGIGTIPGLELPSAPLGIPPTQEQTVWQRFERLFLSDAEFRRRHGIPDDRADHERMPTVMAGQTKQEQAFFHGLEDTLVRVFERGFASVGIHFDGHAITGIVAQHLAHDASMPTSGPERHDERMAVPTPAMPY